MTQDILVRPELPSLPRLHTELMSFPEAFHTLTVTANGAGVCFFSAALQQPVSVTECCPVLFDTRQKFKGHRWAGGGRGAGGAKGFTAPHHHVCTYGD